MMHCHICVGKIIKPRDKKRGFLFYDKLIEDKRFKIYDLRMQKEINISGRQINYQIRKYKLSKNLRLSIRPCFDNELGCENNSHLKILVSMPARASLKMAEKFVHERRSWIIEKIDELKKTAPYSRPAMDKKTYKKEKERARKIIEGRVHYFGDLYGFKFNRIAIRSQRTRWGSCTRNGNLNFNYKLIYLPVEIMDYVIVHELCHLDQLNHSKKFWFLVSEIVPNYRELRRELKTVNI